VSLTLNEENFDSRIRYFNLLEDGQTVGACYDGIPSDTSIVSLFPGWLSGDEIHPQFRRYYYIYVQADFVKVDCVGDRSEEYPDTVRLREFVGSILDRAE